MYLHLYNSCPIANKNVYKKNNINVLKIVKVLYIQSTDISKSTSQIYIRKELKELKTNTST